MAWRSQAFYCSRQLLAGAGWLATCRDDSRPDELHKLEGITCFL
ncbi:hypothetical protein [Brevibacillus agri]|nr:hypothetical protein [Brevibacillus agri]